MEKYKRNLDAIDHTQNRYNDHNKIHIHPYDPQVLEKVREDFLLPRTCKEFIDWVDTHPHYDVVAEASSQYIRGTDRSEAFWQCANIQADWQSINDKITKYCLDNEIDTKFDTDYTEEWRIYDMKDQNTYVPFRHNSELDNQRKHGFKKQYQLIEVTLTDHFAELKDIEQLFGFDWAKTDINYQPTSGAFPRHVDFLTTAFKRAVEFDERIANAKYNPLTKCPEGWVLKRILVPTDSWYPGQMFSFEEHFWTDWKPGQVIDFNWAHCRHATANSGYSPRPLIKITGLVKESHWLAKGEWRDFVL